jgi:hypothetical protein
MTPGEHDEAERRETGEAAADALRRLREAGDAIVAGVERALPDYLEERAQRVLTAWGRLDPSARQRAAADVVAAAGAACTRVVADLRLLFATDAAEQRATPLQIVRSAVREPTAVLAARGVPPVVRDEFAERSWPDDVYGLVPHTLADLDDFGAHDLGAGDRAADDLGPLHLAWGMAKARVLRIRREA